MGRSGVSLVEKGWGRMRPSRKIDSIELGRSTWSEVMWIGRDGVERGGREGVG